jgi:predicted nucleic acid-binding protein
MLVEVLQGFRRDDDYTITAGRLQALTILPMVGPEIALLSAQNSRVLRRRGVTIRSTIDVIIATYCIRLGQPLLFSDRDFEPFVEHLGLLRPAP